MLVFGPFAIQRYGLSGGLLLAGLSLGLIGGLIFGLYGFIQHFFIRSILWRTNSLPWKLIPFLDEATERLFLRKVGGSYIFAHRLLLEYLATIDEPVSSKHTPPNDETRHRNTSPL
ncbi:hypothetical protein [Ktedonospora formicarum]|nr:hypothetical protein [Ktedonospora formicarum]